MAPDQTRVIIGSNLMAAVCMQDRVVNLLAIGLLVVSLLMLGFLVVDGGSLAEKGYCSCLIDQKPSCSRWT